MAKERAQCTVPFEIANRDWCPYYDIYIKQLLIAVSMEDTLYCTK